MPKAPAHQVDSPPTRQDLQAAMLCIVAEIQARPPAEVEADLAAGGGDLELTSPEAIAVIAALESRYGHQLARVEDLEPEQLTSLESLANLVHRSWPVAAPSRGGGQP
jgi:acyl carrier protein